jgi:molybdopterin molybdotransferase
MISVQEAEKRIASFYAPVRIETVPLTRALGRILARDMLSPFAMPEFDKSAMDGFAYAAADRGPAYEIIETIAAGTPPLRTVRSGQCARIMTGAMIPAGADRVVKRECTREENGMMTIVCEDRNSNIRRRGEDLEAGQLAMARGTWLRPAQIALLASLGLAEIPAAEPLRVAVITTGTELVDPGASLLPGQIYNSNSFSLAAQIRALGAVPLPRGRVIDDAAAIVRAIHSAMDECDVLILSGGVSAGDFDFVPGAMKEAGFTLHFEKIAVQPGMPTVFASRGDKAAFGLPGNPVSTFVIFEVFIKPLILRLMGHHFQPLICRANLKDAYRRRQAERGLFLPLAIENGTAAIVSYHGSAHLHALSRANGLLFIPAGQIEVCAGSTVDVRCL